MSDSQQQPWSDNPNAPKIPYYAYLDEKAWFAGIVVSSILYGTPKTRSSIHAHFICSVNLGIIIVLFFKCMVALFNPAHRRGERVKWGLVSYTAIMFALVTIETATNLDVQSASSIDNREFPGIDDLIPPGSYGYQLFISPEALSIIPNVMFLLNNWLADGLLVSSPFGTSFARCLTPPPY